MSRNTVKWTAERRYPYVMLATDLEPTRESFRYYAEVAAENGFEAQSQHRGYLFKVHVDETEELAYETARKYVSGPPNPFLEGNQGEIRPFIQNLPDMTSRTNVLPTAGNLAALRSRGRAAQPTLDQPSRPAASEGRPDRDAFGSYDDQLKRYTIVTGTPDTVIEKVKHVLDYLRPGSVFFWDGDGSMTHEDTMRSLKLMGEEVLPAIREYGDELGLKSPFEVDTRTNEPIAQDAEA